MRSPVKGSLVKGAVVFLKQKNDRGIFINSYKINLTIPPSCLRQPTVSPAGSVGASALNAEVSTGDPHPLQGRLKLWLSVNVIIHQICCGQGQALSLRVVLLFGKTKRHSQSYVVDYFVLLNYRINSSILREIAVNFPIGYAHLILLPLTKLALEVLFVHMLAESLFDKRVTCKFIHSVLKR